MGRMITAITVITSIVAGLIVTRAPRSSDGAVAGAIPMNLKPVPRNGKNLSNSEGHIFHLVWSNKESDHIPHGKWRRT
jgi:hypothetical protein